MNKSEIRKKLLKVRKLNNNKNLDIKFSHIMKILKKEKVNKKSYEKLIDEAADEISSFVEKANLENISK